MKSIVVLLIFFVLAFSADTVQAGSGVELRLAGGVSKLSEPQYYTDHWNIGPSINTGLSYQMTSRLGILMSIEYNRYILDREKLHERLLIEGLAATNDHIQGGNSSILTISVNTLLYIVPKSGAMPIYLVGGAGYFKLSTDKMAIGGIDTPKRSEISWSLLGGVGIDAPLSRPLSLFLERRYGIGYTKTEESRFISANIGVKFDR